jgi:exonuclease SbcC
MKITSLKMKGIGRFHDEVSLPLGQLNGARVIAITGDNGAGKTTLVEGIPGALYGDTPAHGPLARFANAPDSFVELGVETDQAYTIRRLINAVLKTPKTEAYLIGADGQPITNGKLGDFEAAVAKRFPSMRVYLASAFAAQKKAGQFLRIEKAERKALFAEMIGLGHLETMATAAGEKLRAAEMKLAELRAKTETLQDSADLVPELKDAVETDQAGLDAAKDARADAEKALETARAELDAWQTAHAKLVITSVEAKAAQVQAFDKATAATEALTRDQKRLAQLSAKRAGLDEQLGKRAELEQAAADGAGVDAEAERLEQELSDIRAAMDKHSAALLDWQQKKAAAQQRFRDLSHERDTELQRARQNVDVANRDLVTARKAAEGLTKVPCHGEGSYAPCPLIAAATKAHGSINDLDRKLADALERQDEVTADHKAVDAAAADLEAIGDAPAMPKGDNTAAINTTLRQLQVRRNLATDAKAKLEALATVEKQAAELDQEATDLRAAIKSAKLTADQAQGEVQLAEQQHAKAKQAVARHETMRPDAIDATHVEQLRGSESQATAELARAQEALKSAEAAKAELAAVKASTTTAAADLDDWKHLQKALGKDGIQALEVDAAGPEVSELINQLLHECYGSRFTARLQTWQLKADGSGTKEVFDLVVIDTEMGTEGSADRLSGGEEVIVSEALGIAIAIYNSRKSSIPMRDLWRDEVCGALHVTRAPLYVSMLRKALDLGQFDRAFFISHNPELPEIADARIVVEDGKAKVGP